MSTQKCPECLSSFQTRRSTQLYCSAVCSGRSRERRRRDNRRTTNRAATHTLVALEHASGNARLLVAEQQFQRSLQAETSVLLADARENIQARDKVIDEQRTQLQQVNARYFDQSSQLAEAKAECVESKLEVTRLLRERQLELHDLIQIAGRMLQLTDHLGIPLDQPTAEIFRRRGWNTEIRADSR